MSEKEISPTIKLFGKTIPLASSPLNGHDVPTNDDGASPSAAIDSKTAAAAVEEEDCSVKLPSCSETTSPDEQDNKETISKEVTEEKEADNPSDQITEDLKPPTTSSGLCENPKTPSADRETSVSLKSSKNGEQSDETSSSQDKTLKKPDKILPCPRCNSMDTKFCYYNNYNVNQPRHFCKNCQRYWTAGGIMRNVPVGAGRRKNKNASSASHYRHMLMTDALQTARASAASASNGPHNPTVGRNGTVLTFGSDSPLCESMASVLSLAEKRQNAVQNGFHHVPDQQRVLVPSVAGDNGDDQSSGSSNITASNSSERGCKAGVQEPAVHNCQGFPQQVPCFPGPAWPYPWNSPQWNPAMPPPAFFHAGFPISFYPAPPYWGGTAPGNWNVPCNSPPSSAVSHCGTSSGPNSPTLGKHPRDEDIPHQASSQKEESSRENRSDRGVLIPKTLRIDDPSEAAKSSIWETLGIKNEKGNSINDGGIFKSFQSKGDRRQVVEQSLVLQANPAAFSRSLNFRERS